MSELHNEDFILEDDIIFDDDSPDAVLVDEFEKSHLTQEEIDLIKKTCHT